jgi:hypothetical protein
VRGGGKLGGRVNFGGPGSRIVVVSEFDDSFRLLGGFSEFSGFNVTF